MRTDNRHISFFIQENDKLKEIEDLSKQSQDLLINASIDVYNELKDVCCTVHGMTPKRIVTQFIDSKISFSIYTCCEESGKILQLLFFNYVFPVEVRYVNPQLMTDKI